MVGRRYLTDRKESELVLIEQDLTELLNNNDMKNQKIWVRCGYDEINSHKYQDREEVKYRKAEFNETKDLDYSHMLDYIINYELYKSKEDYEEHDGGYDGQVHELHYLKGNGNYIVITG